jgi:hypothetical protein
LIISPHFPPLNAADMQRVRMSLPYFKKFGWDAEVVTVDPIYSEIIKDNLLVASLPNNVAVHSIKAFAKRWTSKFGLGSLAIRSLWFYRQKVNDLIRSKNFDLIYFSTTAFPVCILGAYWKRKFNIPYIIDMQDPWHSEYYQTKPKNQRPPKYWFSYRLNKYLEPIAMKTVSGLISVSESYIIDLKTRYPQIKNIPAKTITFGAFAPDLEIAKNNQHFFTPMLDAHLSNIVYVGRGGNDMHRAVSKLFEAFKIGLKAEPELFQKLRIYFIGTSYAPNGQGQPTITPLAKKFGIENWTIEVTNRITYYHTLVTLLQADALFIPGSDDPQYTASKIYPYLLTQKPLLAVFNSNSSAIRILDEYGARNVYTYDTVEDNGLKIYDFLRDVANKHTEPVNYTPSAVKEYGAENMTMKQCYLFDKVINGQN